MPCFFLLANRYMIKGIKLVIFDLDGTLVDAYPAITSSVNHTLKSLGHPAADKSAIRKSVGWGDENLLKAFIPEKELKNALSVYRKDHAGSLLRGSRLLPGAGKVLSYLKKKGYLLGIASNRPTRFSMIIIRHLGLNKYFDLILCADKLKYIKPHPQILQKILKGLKVSPAEALYIGDMYIDVRTGKAACVRTIAVATGSSSLKELKRERPLRLIRKISSLTELL